MTGKLLYTPYPTLGVENGYTQKNIDILSSLGFDVQGEPLGTKARTQFVLRMLLKRDYEVIVLNWHEHLFCNRHTGSISLSGIIVYLFTLTIFRLSCRKVIYIRHNVVPHALKHPFGRWLAKILMSIGQSIADTKVSHSGHMAAKGYKYLPHPLYDTISPDKRTTKEELPNDYYAIFGRIERYKNILPVIQQWNHASWLVIAGNCKDTEYLQALHSAAEGKQVKFITRFIEENDAQAILSGSKGLILSHSDEDMIVSGSFFYGLSCGIPVYAVTTPFLSWLQEEDLNAPIKVFESCEALLHHISSQKTQQTQADIAQYRTANFGDQKVIECWTEILN